MRSRTVREGSVGLLILVGFLLFGGVFMWLRDFRLGQDSYKITATFTNANRVIAGSPVRYRGVRVGEVERTEPHANGVNIVIRINRVDLSLPRQGLTIEANQSGLVGETSIDIFPQTELASEQAEVSPISEDCDSTIVVCENDTVQGEVGASLDVLIRNTSQAAELISDPELFENIKELTASSTEAAESIAEVSRDISDISGTVTRQLEILTATTEETGEELALTATETQELIRNLNRIVVTNEENIETTLSEIGQTSQELNRVMQTLGPTLETLNTSIEQTDTEKLITNLETLTTNAAETSENLKNASEVLSSSENLMLMQQTLDSARATFENTQKITSDLDELTGDPEFRRNLERLIEGLSDLLSSTQELEQQLIAAERQKQLEETDNELERTINFSNIGENPTTTSRRD
ncbi:MCE family protein [Euhalothece natronophila Z-M001]|uniref:MCE family protein n=1 Tax=Euhalothece natronophila Z-M001 TaxID=522448 RepID=A0A5B8NJ93_9CHRO|nr:MlaD family protein [Euhalothece natronophila]QDZ39054.1 MCE family protein [Euhalothece natronophila Z-M001]